VPQEVWNEVVGEGVERPGSAAVSSASWIDIRTPADSLAVERLRHILDAGEAAAIGLCRELGADLLLCDDLEARRIAAGEGIRVVGTLGLLLRSKQMGLLEAIEPTLSAMTALGFRISRELVDATLDLAGEK
jgi:hypothetical protein